MAKTNEPVFPRRTFPALWMLTTGKGGGGIKMRSDCSSSALVEEAAAAVGIPPGLGAALVIGTSANASANATARNMVF